MKEESAIVLEDFLSENWSKWAAFCADRSANAEAIILEIQEQTGQHE